LIYKREVVMRDTEFSQQCCWRFCPQVCNMLLSKWFLMFWRNKVPSSSRLSQFPRTARLWWQTHHLPNNMVSHAWRP